jgi:hypothetical protein
MSVLLTMLVNNAPDLNTLPEGELKTASGTRSLMAFAAL